MSDGAFCEPCFRRSLVKRIGLELSQIGHWEQRESTSGFWWQILMHSQSTFPYPSRLPVFWFALVSAVFGIAIQVLWGAVQFWINVENQLLAVALPEVTKPGLDPEYHLRIMNPVLDEFISRLYAGRD
jgi:hypothetical protein